MKKRIFVVTGSGVGIGVFPNTPNGMLRAKTLKRKAERNGIVKIRITKLNVM